MDRYRETITALEQSIATTELPQRSWPPISAHGDAISGDDRRLAALWAERRTDNEMAKMLAARCAEKVVMSFYRGLGYEVQDVALEQLNSKSRAWITHDLEVGDGKPVDVKNSRCQIHTDYYVAHDVKHKVAADREVTLTTVLSPFLKLAHIDQPGAIPLRWGVPGVRVLGETVRSEIERLRGLFVTDTFEFEVDVETLIPSWLPEFPSVFYEPQQRYIDYLREPDRMPPDDAWHFLPMPPVAAFVRAGCALPGNVRSRLAEWQIKLAHRLQQEARNRRLTRPFLCLSILSHFLSTLRDPPAGFDPAGYRELLFTRIAAEDSFRGTRALPTLPSEAPYPCGLSDPLARIFGLCETLVELWRNGDREQLQQFRQFRLSNPGLLLARESLDDRWTTLIAYCGGDIRDADGKWMGRCLNYPLVFGREKTCPVCGKLTCGKCGFCTETSRERQRRDQEQISDAATWDASSTHWFDEAEDPGYWVGLAQWNEVAPPPDDDVPWADVPAWWEGDQE